jgi:hypothetical protein
MPEEIRRHIKKEITVNGLSNTLFNGVIAWLLLRGGSPLGWSGQSSFVIDVIATAFILPFIVALIVIPLQRRKVSSGKIHRLGLDHRSWLQRLIGRLPGSLFVAAVLSGLAGMLIFAPAALLPFHLLGVEQIAPLDYSVFKGVWAGVMAAVMAVPMILFALRDPC